MSTAVTIFIIISISLALVFGSLIDVPENRVAVVGESIQFLCSTDQIYSINWQHVPFGSKSVEDVYISRFVVPPYSPRFEVNRKELENNITEYNLMILSVQIEDAGTYRCLDEAGQGQLETAQLIVLESLPNCTSNIDTGGFIGENDCNVQPDTIWCSCTLQYIGNIPPEMNWKTSNERLLKPTSQSIVSGNSISSDLHINATLIMNDSSIVWYPTNSTQNNWTSSSIKILYVMETLSTVIIDSKDNLTCSANSSTTCSYRWLARNCSKSDWEVVAGQHLAQHIPGRYRCEASCPLGNTNCIVTSLHVEYRLHECESAVDRWLIVSLVVSVPVLCALVAVTVILVKRRRKRTKKRRERRTNVFYKHVTH